jgi:hypothetical protein
VEVESIDQEDSDLREDLTVDIEMVEREYECMVLVRH